MNNPLEEPSIPEKLKWPLAALWISLGLHGALIALVQIAPPPTAPRSSTIEARLVFTPQPPTRPELSPSVEGEETISQDIPEAEKFVEPLPEPILPVETTPADPAPPPESAIPQLKIPLAVDLHYYTARELDQTPRGNLPNPNFPDAMSGKIRFEVKIEESGRVSKVEVIESNLQSSVNRDSIEAAREAIRTTLFTPGTRNGRPVRAVVIYELTINPATP